MVDDVLWRMIMVCNQAGEAGIRSLLECLLSWMDTLRKYLMGFEEVLIVVWVRYISWWLQCFILRFQCGAITWLVWLSLAILRDALESLFLISYGCSRGAGRMMLCIRGVLQCSWTRSIWRMFNRLWCLGLGCMRLNLRNRSVDRGLLNVRLVLCLSSCCCNTSLLSAVMTRFFCR